MSTAPEYLADLIDKSTRILVDQGLDKDHAIRAAHAIADAVRKDWGGQNIYFAKGMAIDITERDMALWARFNGKNHKELAKEFDITEIHVYRRLAAIGPVMRALKQPDLFGDN